MFNKIVFFHQHVNGDSFHSRILVKQIIDATKEQNIMYYYTAPRAYISYCLDLGISDEHFNMIPVLKPNLLHYIENEILFINVWIGITTGTIEDQNMVCALCLNNVIPKFNFLIKSLNNTLNMNIELLDENKNISPYIEINNKYYNTDFIENFINKNKEKYDKIVLICNNNPSTFTSMVNITRGYLLYIINKFPNYLFITFQNTKITQTNLISIEKIYNETNTPISNNWAIMFPVLSKLSDKVILLPTGPSFACFNNETTKNKFMMLFDFSDSGNPYNCPHCKTSKEKLCNYRFGWDITLMDVNYNDRNLANNICYFILDFLIK